jgi:hypothetical protein
MRKPLLRLVNLGGCEVYDPRVVSRVRCRLPRPLRESLRLPSTRPVNALGQPSTTGIKERSLLGMTNSGRVADITNVDTKTLRGGDSCGMPFKQPSVNIGLSKPQEFAHKQIRQRMPIPLSGQRVDGFWSDLKDRQRPALWSRAARLLHQLRELPVGTATFSGT